MGAAAPPVRGGVIAVACGLVALHVVVFFFASVGGWRPLSLTLRKYDHDICLIGTCTERPAVGVVCARHGAGGVGRVRRGGVIASMFALVFTAAGSVRLLRRLGRILARRGQPEPGEPAGTVGYPASQLVGPILMANIFAWVVLWGIQPQRREPEIVVSPGQVTQPAPVPVPPTAPRPAR